MVSTGAKMKIQTLTLFKVMKKKIKHNTMQLYLKMLKYISVGFRSSYTGCIMKKLHKNVDQNYRAAKNYRN